MSLVDHNLLVKLAREIALDVNDIDDILRNMGISREQFQHIRDLPAFDALLKNAISEWQGALNTSERVKIKTAIQLEAWLPELNTRLHDQREALPAKIEGAKLLARLAGYGVTGADIREEGSRFSLQIIINPNKTTTIDAPMKTIEGDRLE